MNFCRLKLNCESFPTYSNNYRVDWQQKFIATNIYRRAHFKRLQILRISWILAMGISTKFVSPKISGNSIVTQIAD